MAVGLAVVGKCVGLPVGRWDGGGVAFIVGNCEGVTEGFEVGASDGCGDGFIVVGEADGCSVDGNGEGAPDGCNVDGKGEGAAEGCEEGSLNLVPTTTLPWASSIRAAATTRICSPARQKGRT